MKRAMLRAGFSCLVTVLFSMCGESVGGFNDTGETRKDAHDTGHG